MGGGKWVGLTTAGTDETIYTKNGSLPENRIVSTGDNSLTIYNDLSSSKIAGRDAFVLQRSDNAKEIGLSFQNSGGFHDVSIALQSGTSSSLLFATGGNVASPNDLVTTMTLGENGQMTLPRYSGTSFDGNPISFLGVDAAGNILKSPTAPITKNIYNSDGALTGQRTMTMGANSLRFANTQGRTLDLIPAVADNNSPFTFQTNNSINFVIDADDALTIKSNANVGIKQVDPQKELHVGGTASTIRIDGLNAANNVNNNVEDVVPVYVNNAGDLVTQPSLTQNKMALNLRNPIPPTIVDSPDGSAKTVNLNNSTITLTQRSLVHYSYQFSVSATRSNNAAITDGASRLFRAYFTVNTDTANQYGFDTGTYTNNPDVESPGGIYAAGNYYLSGSGYVELPKGTHTFKLFGLGFGAGFDFKMNFGDTTFDSIQAVIIR